LQKNAEQQAALLDIIGLIYDTPNNPNLWPELLESLDALALSHTAGSDSTTDNDASHEYISLLLPHFHRAITIDNEADNQYEKTAALSNILDQLPLGVILVNATNTPVTLNSRAHDFLKTSSFLRIEKDKLVANTSKDTGLLYKLIKLANQGKAQDFLMATKDNKTCALHIKQASKADIKYISDLTAIFITCTDTQRTFSSDKLMAMLHITEAEARLVSTLLDSSHNLSEAADAMNISKHTVRNQMKSILEKTNTSSQSELLKQVLRSRDAIIEGSETVETTLNSHNADNGGNNTFSTLSLYDGSELEYTEYGDPSGIPILYFHSIIHSRQTFNPFSDFIETHGLRIIAPERPGFGATSLPKRISHTAFANNIKQLTEHLGLEKFYVLGEGNGGAFALACAAILPDQVIRASVVACVPDKNFDHVREVHPFERQLHRIKQKASAKLLFTLGKVILKVLSKHDYLLRLMSSYYCPSDWTIVQSSAYRQLYQESMRNTLDHNTKGFVEDYFARIHPWDFQTQNILSHIDIWHGDSDTYTKIESAKAIADSIPNHTTYFLENHGYCIFFSHADRILEQLVCTKN